MKEGRGRFRGKKRSARQRSTFVRFSFDFRIICILLGGQVRSKSFIDGKLEEVEDITDEIERSKDRSEIVISLSIAQFRVESIFDNRFYPILDGVQ